MSHIQFVINHFGDTVEHSEKKSALPRCFHAKHELQRKTQATHHDHNVPIVKIGSSPVTVLHFVETIELVVFYKEESKI